MAPLPSVKENMNFVFGIKTIEIDNNRSKTETIKVSRARHEQQPTSHWLIQIQFWLVNFILPHATLVTEQNETD